MCIREKCQRLIDTHQDRFVPKGEAFLTPAQRNIFQAVSDFVRISRSPILRYADIKSKYKGGLQLSDFCYNLVNIGPDFEVKFLRSLDRGRYEFVNFNWDTAENIKITWLPKSSDELRKQPFTVGHYRMNRYEWDFKELAEFL